MPKSDYTILPSGIEDIIKKSISETFSHLKEDEKDKQDQMADDLKRLDSGEVVGDADVSEADENDDESEDEGNSKDNPDVKVPAATDSRVRRAKSSDILKLINIVRSGPSIKSGENRKALEAYLNDLRPEDRQAAYVILTGLAQVISTDTKAKDAIEPSDKGIKISTPDNKEEPVIGMDDVDVPQDDEIIPIVVGECYHDRRNKLSEGPRKSLREDDVTLSDGSSAIFGSDEHLEDLESTLASMVRIRDYQARGSASRENYTRTVGSLRNQIRAAKRANRKLYDRS